MTQDISLGPKMISKGKLNIIPEMIKDKAKISRIFKKTSNQGGLK
jgi:hypothetical protein